MGSLNQNEMDKMSILFKDNNFCAGIFSLIHQRNQTFDLLKQAELNTRRFKQNR